jgi:preprotein translocase subunit SecB
MTPIPISPLQLKGHFFPVIRLNAQPGGKKEGPTNLAREIAFAPVSGNPKSWQLELTVKLSNSDKTNPFLYEFEIHVIGFFEMEADPQEERTKQIVIVNGLSMLYGAIRELIINLTSRSAFGALTVPSLSFADAFKEVLPSSKQ